MFTYEEVCRSMAQVKHEPMTPESVRIFADLLYIKRHWPDEPGEKASEDGLEEHMLTRAMATEWCDQMQNADGTTGPHWTEDQAKQMMEQKGIGGPPLEFWVALNATYSDLCKVFQKYGINNIDAYIDFAKEFWLNDKDSVPDKLARYYRYVVL